MSRSIRGGLAGSSWPCPFRSSRPSPVHRRLALPRPVRPASFGPDSKKPAVASAVRALAEHADGDAAAPAGALLALFDKQGMAMFEGRKAFRHLGAIDAWYFETALRPSST